jgi:hypothetical protein
MRPLPPLVPCLASVPRVNFRTLQPFQTHPNPIQPASIPADIRIIESYDLKVECSSLTGESDLVPATVNRHHDAAAEAGNLIFMSSLAMNGEGRGIVIRTGAAACGGGGRPLWRRPACSAPSPLPSGHRKLLPASHPLPCCPRPSQPPQATRP